MSKLPEKVDDWKAPWETETGETEIDKGKLKRYLFGLLGDKEKLQERASTAETRAADLEKQVTEKSREGETEVDRLKRELQEAKDAAGKAGGDTPEVLKLRVALEKGIPAGDVKRLVGSTEEELKADADELLKSFGLGGKDDNGGDGGSSGAGVTRRAPRGTNNPGDPNPGEGAEVTFEKAMDAIPRVR